MVSRTLRFKGTTNAHVGFFCGPRKESLEGDYTQADFYEIVLGGWANELSVIRKRPCPDFKYELEHTLHQNYTDEWVTVTVSFINGDTITAAMGEEPLEKIFLMWTDPNPMNVTHIALMSGWESGGMDWEIKRVERPIGSFEQCPRIKRCPMEGCAKCDECELCEECEEAYQFIKYDDYNNTCEACPENCLRCEGTECGQCQRKFVFDYDGICVGECPRGQFADHE